MFQEPKDWWVAAGVVAMLIVGGALLDSIGSSNAEYAIGRSVASSMWSVGSFATIAFGIVFPQYVASVFEWKGSIQIWHRVVSVVLFLMVYGIVFPVPDSY